MLALAILCCPLVIAESASTFDKEQNASVKELCIESRSKVSINLDEYPNLESLSISTSTNVSLKIGVNNNIKKLELMDNDFVERSVLNLNSLKHLEKCTIYGNAGIIISGKWPESIQKLCVLNNWIDSLKINLSGCKNLVELAISNVSLVDLSGCSTLESLNVSNSHNFTIVGKLQPTLKYIDLHNVSFAEKTEIKQVQRTVSTYECNNLTIH
jgi:hypothetical protein